MPVNHNSPLPHAELLRSIEDEFVRVTSDVLGASCGRGMHLNTTTAPDTQTANLWFALEFRQFENAPMVIAVGREKCLSLGKAMASRSGSPASDEAEALSRIAGSWSQVAEALAAFLTVRVKQEIIANPVQTLMARPAQSRPEHVTAYEVQLPSTQRIKLELLINPNLLDAVANLEPGAETQTRPAPSIKNLDLLLDVEMPVSVSFGRAQLPLKDVIKLTTGSIVELSRSVSEPVEIIVNNCVIARGEVVVVDGNFGVRIKEISSKQERLRTLS
jgi:flagellar motor switch protein FliN